MRKVIIHVDIDSFFASVECVCDPRLCGKPVVVVGNRPRRVVVSSASYEARRYGVHSGMPLAEAQRRCPFAVIIPGDFEKYLDTSSRIWEILGLFTPDVEVFSVDEAFLDATSTARFFGGPVSLGMLIKRRIASAFGLTCSVGIGPNRFLAKLATNMRKPNGLFVIKEADMQGELSRLPVGKLWGIGERLRQKLKNMGIETVSELARVPLRILIDKFGVLGERLFLMARGELDEPLKPVWKETEVKSIGHTYTLNEETRRPDVIRRFLLWLAERVGWRLRRGGYQGRTVTLILRWSNFYTFIRQLSVGHFLYDGYEIYKICLKIMQGMEFSNRAVRMIGVSVSGLVKGGEEGSLLPEVRRREKVLQAVDDVNRRYGEFTVHRASISRIPFCEGWGDGIQGFNKAIYRK
jgi:DNA polymerase-4